jgi:hypothetical protein
VRQQLEDGAGHERSAFHVTLRYATANWRPGEISADHRKTHKRPTQPLSLAVPYRERLKGGSGAEQRQNRREQGGQNQAWGESTEGSQDPAISVRSEFPTTTEVSRGVY